MADLEYRVEELSKNTKESIERLNARVDLFLNLAKNVALLEAKSDTHGEDLERLEKALETLKGELLKEIDKVEEAYKQLMEDKKEAINRIHGRLDNLSTEAKTEVGKVKEQVDTTDRKLENRVSFFKGMVFVLGITMVIIQGAGLYVYRDIEKKQDTNAADISTIFSKIHENERQMDQIVNSIASRGR